MHLARVDLGAVARSCQRSLRYRWMDATAIAGAMADTAASRRAMLIRRQPPRGGSGSQRLCACGPAQQRVRFDQSATLAAPRLCTFRRLQTAAILTPLATCTSSAE